MNHQQAKRQHGCGCETRAIHRISLSLWGIGRHSTFKGSLPFCAAVCQLPQIPSVHEQTAEEWEDEAEDEEEKTRWAPVRCGYVAGWSGLLTGLPPFMTAGSLVLLLGGADALGTVSPMSCSEGSLYMATGKAESTRKSSKTPRKTCFCCWFKNVKRLLKNRYRNGAFHIRISQ